MAQPRATTPLLAGFWEHERCQVAERDGQRTGSRSVFSFFEREWGIAFTQYADGDCRTKVLTAVLSGAYESTGLSQRLPGTADVTFRFSRKALTVYDQALLDTLNRNTCGDRRWQLGIEQDVTSSGCLWVESVAACPQEYDLVKIDGGRLFLGERPPAGGDVCAASRRPARYGPCRSFGGRITSHAGGVRFGALKRRIPGISTKMLTLHLRQLEADDIVRRTETKTQSPREVIYDLSPRAKEIRTVVAQLHRWGHRYARTNGIETTVP